MIADSARVDESSSDGQTSEDTPPPVELKSKDDIKNFLKGIM
jgi:hypothetical protein|nr:MAG: hypothetical protein [Bacteriophage sp.]DAP58061.1 MAG TPA: hypothetical protein [Caudoviricetes sp.]